MTETDRNTVLDSLTLFGGALSLNGAAAKYGVPRGTIGRWVSERKAGRPVANVVKLATVPPAPEFTREHAPSSKIAIIRGKVAAEGLGPELRADIRAATASLIRFTRQASQLAADGPPADLDPAAREDWRPPDMRQIKAATAALADLLSNAADVLAFDERTTATADKDALSDAEAVRAEVLRRRRG